MKKSVSIILILFIVSINIFLGYKIFTNSSKVQILQNFRNMYKEVTNVIKSRSESKIALLSKNNVMEFNSKVSFESDSNLEEDELSDLLKDFNLEIKGQTDYKNNKLMFDLLSSIDKEELVNFSMFMDNETIYLFYEELYDKYIGFEDIISFEEMKSEKSIEDTEYLLNKIVELFAKSLKNEYFTSDKQEITIDSKRVSTTKNTMILNGKRLQEILVYISSNLRKDEKSIEIIKDLYNFETKEQTIEFMTVENDESLEYDETEEIKYSIYTKGLLKEVVRYEIEVVDSKITIDLYEKENLKISEINFYNYETLSLNIKIKTNNEKIIVEMTTYDIEETKIILEISNEETEVKKDEEYNQKTTIKATFNVDNEEISYQMTIDTNYKVIAEFETIEEDMLVLETELSEEDSIGIIDFLYAFADKFYINVDDDYGDDYDYDYEETDYDFGYDY